MATGTSGGTQQSGSGATRFRHSVDGVVSPGMRLGRYEVLFSVGAGGMAEVFAGRAIDGVEGDSAIAIKAMLPHLARDPHFVDMFHDEGRITQCIHSPYVVQTLDMGREEDILYLVMELVVGPPLSLLLRAAEVRSARLPVPVALSIAAQTARGLHDVHTTTGANGERLSIVHRDVSPHNILVGADGRARLTDFGVARALERRSSTMTGEWKGKVQYFAPEQLSRSPVDQRVDVFALGLVTWELCTGRRLFDGDNVLLIAQEIRDKDIPRLDDIAGLPKPVADVVARSLVRDRQRRTPSAADFYNDLVAAAQATTGLAEECQVGDLVRQLAGPEVDRIANHLREARLRSGVAASRSAGRRETVSWRVRQGGAVASPRSSTELSPFPPVDRARPRWLIYPVAGLGAALLAAGITLVVERQASFADGLDAPDRPSATSATAPPRVEPRAVTSVSARPVDLHRPAAVGSADLNEAPRAGEGPHPPPREAGADGSDAEDLGGRVASGEAAPASGPPGSDAEPTSTERSEPAESAAAGEGDVEAGQTGRTGRTESAPANRHTRLSAGETRARARRAARRARRRAASRARGRDPNWSVHASDLENPWSSPR